MSSENHYESFLRERWFAMSQDAARAEALLQLITEKGSGCRLTPHLRARVEQFLMVRKTRREEAQARVDDVEKKRERAR